jgi:hypothetical protein
MDGIETKKVAEGKDLLVGKTDRHRISIVGYSKESWLGMIPSSCLLGKGQDTWQGGHMGRDVDVWSRHCETNGGLTTTANVQLRLGA